MTHRLLPTSHRSLLADLHDEWRVLARRPEHLRRARRWELGVAFGSLDELVAATGFWAARQERLARASRTAGALEADTANDVMARLLVVARVDELAARVVLQRLLPGLVTRARHWAQREGGAEALDDLVATAWTVIRTYPVERRPRHLVANLLRDAEYQAFIRPRRRLVVHELVPTTALDRAAELDDRPDPADELRELIDQARLLTARDRHLLGLLAGGASMAEVAVEYDVSVRTIANRRDAAVHRIREAVRA